MIRDVVLFLVGGVVLEPTLKTLNFDELVPYLPQVWFVILLCIISDVVLRSTRLRAWATGYYQRATIRAKMASFVIVALVGVAASLLLWFAITGIFAARQKSRSRAESQTPTASPTPASPLILQNVHPSFHGAYKRFEKELGSPTGDAKAIVNVYHAEHQHATVLLPSNVKDVYLLNKDDFKLKILPDPKTTEAVAFWWNSDEVKRKFKDSKLGVPPKGLSYPFGPIARGWFNDPDEWKWIGWKESHCIYQDKTTYLQDFEHGVIIGSIRESADRGEAQVGRILILLTDTNVLRWDSEPYDKKPRCDTPNNDPSVEFK